MNDGEKWNADALANEYSDTVKHVEWLEMALEKMTLLAVAYQQGHVQCSQCGHMDEEDSFYVLYEGYANHEEKCPECGATHCKTDVEVHPEDYLRELLELRSEAN